MIEIYIASTYFDIVRVQRMKNELTQALKSLKQKRKKKYHTYLT